MSNQININVVLDGKVALPAGLELKDNSIFLDKSKIKSNEDMEKLYAFITSIVGEIPKNPYNLKVGNYMVATDIAKGDPVFGSSIIKIDSFKPLLRHVGGTGVIKDHPSDGFNAGWSLEQLAGEISIGCWQIMDKDAVTEYAKQRNLNINL